MSNPNETQEIKAASEDKKLADANYKASSNRYHEKHRRSLYTDDGVRSDAFRLAGLYELAFHATTLVAQLQAAHRRATQNT
jgi:hypothetical protein